jgi:HSP20 family protein
MAAVVRWDPFRELAGVQERMNRLFSQAYGRSGDDDVMSRGDWLPPVDIFQAPTGELVMKVEVPGIKKEDIDIRVENNTLTVRGERKLESEVKQEQYHRIERTYGTFVRTFSLPNQVATDQVRADYRDGVLTVNLPIREEAKPKQIQVKVGE